jgi:hypothetical protein
MLLQIMSLSRDIRNRGLSRTEFDSCDLPDGRVGLLGFRRVDFGADGFLLETLFEEGSFGEFGELLTGSSSDCISAERVSRHISRDPGILTDEPWLMVALATGVLEKDLNPSRDGPATQAVDPATLADDRRDSPEKADSRDLDKDMVDLSCGSTAYTRSPGDNDLSTMISIELLISHRPRPSLGRAC